MVVLCIVLFAGSYFVLNSGASEIRALVTR
jgi:hypothetical protein